MAGFSDAKGMSAMNGLTAGRRRVGGVCAALGVLSMATSPVGSQPSDPTGSSPPAPIHVPSINDPIVFERTHLDIGFVSDFDEPVHTFKFTNVSKKPVRLRIDGCHFCGIPKTDKDVYQPGESGVVIVEVHTRNKGGLIRAGGIVAVEGHEGMTIPLEIKAIVRQRVAVDQDQVYMRNVIAGMGARARLEVTGRETGFKVTSVKGSDDSIAIALREPEEHETTDDKWRSQVIDIASSPALAEGNYQPEITILTNDARVPEIRVTVNITVVGHIGADPSRVNVGLLYTDEPFAQTFRVESRWGVPIQIEEIDVPTPGLFGEIALDYRPGPANMWTTVTVVGRTSRRPIQFTEAVIRVTTVDVNGRRDRVQVPLGGSVRQRPE